jgi:hypothetical protein
MAPSLLLFLLLDVDLPAGQTPKISKMRIHDLTSQKSAAGIVTSPKRPRMRTNSGDPGLPSEVTVPFSI